MSIRGMESRILMRRGSICPRQVYDIICMHPYAPTEQVEAYTAFFSFLLFSPVFRFPSFVSSHPTSSFNLFLLNFFLFSSPPLLFALLLNSTFLFPSPPITPAYHILYSPHLLSSTLLSSSLIYSTLLFPSSRCISPLLFGLLSFTLLFSPLPDFTLLCSTLLSSSFVYSTLFFDFQLPAAPRISPLLFRLLPSSSTLFHYFVPSPLLSSSPPPDSTLPRSTLLSSSLFYSTPLSCFHLLAAPPALLLSPLLLSCHVHQVDWQ